MQLHESDWVYASDSLQTALLMMRTWRWLDGSLEEESTVLLCITSTTSLIIA